MGKYESPDYSVILEENHCEIRKYIDFYIVEYDNHKDPEINQGFGTLFRYISNDNQKNKKFQ